MNNKGFSLVEILGVIAILSVITIASFTVLDGVAKRNIDKTYKIQLNEILDGAISYANSTRSIPIPDKVETAGCSSATVLSGNYEGPKQSLCKLTIDLQTLFDEGIIDEDIENPKTKKKILGSSTIVITYLEYNANSSVNVENNQKINGRNLYTINLVEES